MYEKTEQDKKEAARKKAMKKLQEKRAKEQEERVKFNGEDSLKEEKKRGRALTIEEKLAGAVAVADDAENEDSEAFTALLKAEDELTALMDGEPTDEVVKEAQKRVIEAKAEREKKSKELVAALNAVEAISNEMK